MNDIYIGTALAERPKPPDQREKNAAVAAELGLEIVDDVLLDASGKALTTPMAPGRMERELTQRRRRAKVPGSQILSGTSTSYLGSVPGSQAAPPPSKPPSGPKKPRGEGHSYDRPLKPAA